MTSQDPSRKGSRGRVAAAIQPTPDRIGGVRVMTNYCLRREEINVDTGEHRLVFAIRSTDDTKSLRRLGVGWKEVSVSRDLARQRGDLERELARQGLLSPSIDSDWLDEVLASTRHRRRYTTARGGWQGDVLVTRYGSFPPRGERSRYRFDRHNRNYRKAERTGTFSEFTRGVRPFLLASTELTFAYALALLPPLATRIGRKGGIVVCYSAESSTGKSTSIRLAQSLSTSAKNDSELVNFGSTPGILIDGAPAFGAQLTGFNDIKAGTEKAQALADKLQTVAFSALNGEVRGRKGEAQLPEAEFNVYFLSAEKALQTLFEEGGRTLEDGDRARLLDIPIPSRDEGGILAAVAPEERASIITDLDVLLSRQHGRVMPRWVRKISAQDAGLLSDRVERIEAAFMQNLGLLSGLEDRIAKQFALIYAVGRVAIDERILPSSADRLLDVIKGMVSRAHNALVPDEATSRGPNLSQRLDYLLADADAFPLEIVGRPLSDGVTADTGFRRREKPSQAGDTGHTLYISKKGLAARLSLTDPAQLDGPLRSLRQRGMLAAGRNELTAPVKQLGLTGRPRLLVVNLPTVANKQRGK